MQRGWKNPIQAFDPDSEPPPDVPTAPYRRPTETWEETTAYKMPTHPVGRLRYYYKWPGHGERTWLRPRWWPTRRRVLDIRGEYNPKTLQTSKDHRRQASDLVGGGVDRAFDRAIVRARESTKCASDRRRDFRHLRRDQSLLDADHRHRPDLFAGELCGRRCRGLWRRLFLDPVRSTLVVAAAGWHDRRHCLRRGDCASGKSPGWLLLRASHPRSGRALPGLCDPVPRLRFSHGRALRC